MKPRILDNQYPATNVGMNSASIPKENKKANPYAIGIFVNRSFHGLRGDSQKPRKIRIPDQIFLILII